MVEILTPAQYPEFDAFVRGHEHGCFMQSPAWAKVKSEWKHEVVALRDDAGAITAGISILIRPVGPVSLMYAPRGPVCGYADTDALAQLLAGAKAVAQKHRAYILIMDPYILETEQDLIDKWVAAGCDFTPNASFKATIQPRYNYMLPYIGGMTEEQLLAGFSRNTRNKMRHPGKHGVVCKNMGLAGMDDFYAIYSETGTRQGFSVRPRAYLESFLTAFPDDARLYMCYTEDGIPLCGGLAVNYGGKCAHVYGCSADHHRDLRPTYLLQWHLMNWALEKGCTIYDMQGVAVDPEDSPALYGVLGFKQSFKGEIVTTAGEFNIVYRPVLNKLLNTAVELRGKLHRTLYKLTHPAKPEPRTEKAAQPEQSTAGGPADSGQEG